jgi:para-aminobenzoate synthetase / 4-amino-4-deoxychorismate lyase
MAGMNMPEVFALLDDHAASADQPTSRRYTGWVREHRCTDPVTLDATWAAIQADLAAGLHAVVLADYEWGAKLVGAGLQALGADDASALRVLMFRHGDRLSHDEVEAWLQSLDTGAPAGFSRLHPAVTDAEFTAAIDQIQDWIRAGETYQVNYTYRLHGQAWGEPVALYRALRRRQPVRYGALMRLPGDVWVLSCSPELFLQHRAGTLLTKPMKGTAERRPVAEADSAMAGWLHGDEKNRAENLMIVDLLRNDLGRIARVGSVQVPELFSVEGYRTVFQMTSTVQAQIAPEVGLPAVLRALFPCGSITGAPKHHTMDLIARLENTPRGLYCGAIGWLDAPAEPGRALGDFCLSVAIRTVTLSPPLPPVGAASAAMGSATGEIAAEAAPTGGSRRAATLGVGAGITLDSVAADEADECRLKARFATALDPGFTLFETMRAEGGQLLRLDAHLARLTTSAQALGFAWDEAAARAALAEALTALPPGAPYRVRLDLNADGQTTVRSGILQALPDGPVPLRLAPDAVVPATEAGLLAHKTSRRSAYDAAIQAAETEGAFDTLFFNARGALTEGGRSNIFVRIDGQWRTPPLSGDALPGVMRGEVLAGRGGLTPTPIEAVITHADLQRADAIAVCNSLRGLLPATIATTKAPSP